MSSFDWKLFLEKCENDLRAGQVASVRHHLHQITVAEIPRLFRFQFANIARRVDMNSFGLRVLTPVVRVDRKQDQEASPAEISEYAALLLRFGAVREALSLLSPLRTPEAQLFQAFCHFSIWQYSKALPFLDRYIEIAPNPYMAFVGNVNRAAALVNCDRNEEALKQLADNIQVAKKEQYIRLLANCQELSAQVFLFQGDLEKAKRCLDEAHQVMGAAQSSDQLFITKWRSILSAFEQKSEEPLLQFRREAEARRHFETIREIDLFRVIVNFQQDRFDWLYFGTPFESYRQRILTKTKAIASSDFYCWGTNRNGSVLNLQTGEIDQKAALKTGTKTHQLLEILLRDFYKPIGVGSLYGELFPGDYFDIFSSPHRIHQLITQARMDFREAGVDLKIDQQNGLYQLTGSMSVQLPVQRRPLDSGNLTLQKLQNAFALEQAFTKSSACQVADMSASAFVRWTGWAIQKGVIEKFGAGPSTKYYFKNSEAA